MGSPNDGDGGGTWCEKERQPSRPSRPMDNAGRLWCCSRSNASPSPCSRQCTDLWNASATNTAQIISNWRDWFLEGREYTLQPKTYSTMKSNGVMAHIMMLLVVVGACLVYVFLFLLAQVLFLEYLAYSVVPHLPSPTSCFRNSLSNFCGSFTF